MAKKKSTKKRTTKKAPGRKKVARRSGATTRKKSGARKKATSRAKKSAGMSDAAQAAARTFVWHELLTNDVGRAARFYKDLLGWGSREMPMAPGPYTIWQQQGKDVGGMMAISPDWGNVPPHWMIYIAVDDVDETVRRAERMGGRVHAPPMDIPNTGRFAILADPTGASFAVFKG